jgi:hypothetical protein
MRYEGGPKNDRSFISIDNDRFVVLDVNPQSVSMREPVATAITFTQGGGKIRESRGNLVKPVSISGTTGYTPLPQGASLHAGSSNPGLITTTTSSSRSLVPTTPAAGQALENQLAARSGFFAFHRLRHLFRRYAYELREGDTFVTLHYIDTKNEEFWRIEPQEFSLSRSSRKPFSYDYNIGFTIIDVSTGRQDQAEHRFGLGLIDQQKSGVSQFRNLSAGTRSMLRRILELTQTGNNFIKKLSGTVQRRFQRALRNLDDITRFFENIHDAFTTVIATPLVLLNQAASSLSGLAQVATALNEDVFTIRSGFESGFSLENNLTGELNEWYLEARRSVEFMKASLIAIGDALSTNVLQENRKYSTGQAKQGIATSVMQPTENSVGTPDVNPFLTSSGLGLVTNINELATTSAVQTVVVNQGDTIFSLALRLLGDTNRFIDLVLMNNLQSPYIVSNTAAKPSGTIAWGEFIQVPTVGSNSLVASTAPPALIPTVNSTVSDTGTAYELIDTVFTENGLPGWIPNQWHGYTVTLTHLGVDYQRVVIANTLDHLEINVAWPVLPSVGDAYTLRLIQFDANRPVTPEVKTFGSDVLLQFVSANGRASSSELADIVIGSTKDLSLARGLNNFIQAINIRVRVEQGRLPLNPGFGVQLPVGRPWNDDLGILYKFFLRDSILSDPRVQSVGDMQLALQRDQFSLNLSIQPVHVKNSQTVSATLP